MVRAEAISAAGGVRRRPRFWVGLIVCVGVLVPIWFIVIFQLQGPGSPHDLVWPIPPGTTVASEEFHDHMGSSQACEYNVVLKGHGSTHLLADVVAYYESRGFRLDNHMGDGSLDFHAAAWPGRDGGRLFVDTYKNGGDLVVVGASHAPDC